MSDGNYKVFTISGAFEKKFFMKVNLIGMKNYCMWCMVVIYGFCFGVEFMMNNIVVGYFFD